MKSAPFAYDAPETLDEAVALLAEHGSEAKILAGGQSLVPLLNMRLARPGVLVDINRIAPLRFIRVDEDGTLVIGAATRQIAAEGSRELAEGWPMLVEALALIGHTTIRNQGTVGGSLAHADPSAELPAAAVALGATFRVVGPRGERTVPAREAYVGYLTTVLEPDEILTEIRFPAPAPRTGTAFLEVSRRHGDYAMVSAAATVTLDEDGRCGSAAVVLGGVAETPVLAGPKDGELRGRQPDEAAIRDASRLYTAELQPPEDMHADATYRKEVAEVLTRRALTMAVERATKGA